MYKLLNIKILWIAILLPFCLLASIEDEILVLFKADIIQMPLGKDMARLDEIVAPQTIINCMQVIGVQTIGKALPNFNRADTLRITEDNWVARLPNFSQLYILELPSSTIRDSAIIKLEGLNGIIYAEKNQKITFLTTNVNDPKFNEQWNLNDSTGTIGIDVMNAWDLSKGSSSVKIGIVDTGVDSLHEDLTGKVTGAMPHPNPASHPDNFHGTYVAGIAAANTNNDTGIAGVDWHARIHSSRIEGTDVPAAIAAVTDAVNTGCKIINCSWALPSWSPSLYSTFVLAYQCNALPVAAELTTDNNFHYPARFGPWMCNIAATTLGNVSEWNPYAPYSMKTPWVDMAAPGGEEDYSKKILSTTYNQYYHNLYRKDRGTSAAAPHEAGQGSGLDIGHYMDIVI